MGKLTIADLVPKKQVFVAKGERNGEPFEIEIEFTPFDTPADLFECFGVLGQTNGLYEAMARLTGYSAAECAYVFLAADNRDDLVKAVGKALGSEGHVDPTAEGSTE